ncbi:MAG: hypothetical protein IJO52_01405, partial [Clostridia bacterium]|nr:hypothetical protein [Clostridia bacterium]
ANADRDVRLLDEPLDSAARQYCFTVPWIKKFDKELIEKIAGAFRNVIENHLELSKSDVADATQGGRWYGFENQQ